MSLRSPIQVRSFQSVGLSLWLSCSASGPGLGYLSSLANSLLAGLCSLLLLTPPFPMAVVWGELREMDVTDTQHLLCWGSLDKERLLCLLQVGMQGGHQGAHGEVEAGSGGWGPPSLSLLTSTPLLWSLGPSFLGFYNPKEEFSGRSFSRGSSDLCFSLSCFFR